MVSESIAIIFVWLVLFIAFLRAKHIGYAVAVLPITFTPFMYLTARGILLLSDSWLFGTRPSVALAFINFVVVVISCAVIVIIGGHIDSKRNRRLYLVTMLSYTILLGWAYIFNSLQAVLL